MSAIIIGSSLLLVFSITLTSSTQVIMFRSDYIYSSITDSYYKIHLQPRRGYTVSSICVAEGTQLLLATDPEDFAQVILMMKRYPDLGNYAYVSNEGASKYGGDERSPVIDLPDVLDTFEGPMGFECQVVSRAGRIETTPCFNHLPFFCKVSASNVSISNGCKVYGSGYTFTHTGSCYKIPSVAYDWNEAYGYCKAEGSHLAVINSDLERRLLQNLTETATVTNALQPWFFHVGFRAKEPVENGRFVFETIFGKNLSQAGFNEWSPGEPNNANGREYCGSFYMKKGTLNDVDCSEEYGFICEKEIKKM